MTRPASEAGGRWIPGEVETLYTPPLYPSPDWDAEATIARVWRGDLDGPTYAWLILQGEALAWLSLIGPEEPGDYAVSRWVFLTIRAGAANHVPASRAWAEILPHVLHHDPTTEPASVALAEYDAACGR